VFQATTRMTPHRYVLKRRVERARELLTKTHLSIAEIAYRCGFANQAHLTLAFGKECGLTPGEYRRQLSRTRFSINSRHSNSERCLRNSFGGVGF
jgi:AraC family transcriptional regulator